MTKRWPEIFYFLPWDARIGTLAAIGVLIVAVIGVLLVVHWVSGWRTENLLRNQLEARRRLRDK